MAHILQQSFLTILNMSFTAGIVIVAVFLARLALRKAPRIFSYCLWAVVLFRLICPISFSAPFSLMGMLQVPLGEQGRVTYFAGESSTQMQSDMAGELSEDGSTLTHGGDINGEVDHPTENQATGELQADRALQGRTLIQAVRIWAPRIWVLGISVMLAYSVVTYLLLKKKLKSAVHVEDTIYMTERISTPFVCGFFSPKIYLPDALGEAEKEYILLHEQIHIRRGDHIVKVIGFLALCLHWFNPLVWLAFFLSGKDMEMACDEAVIRRIGSGVKKEYSSSLLSLATGKHIVSGVPLAFGEGDTGGRIKNVLRYRKPTLAILCGAVVLTVIVAAVLVANPKEKTADQENSGKVTYSGVIEDVDIEGTIYRLVNIPGQGGVELPEAAKIYSNVEGNEFQGLKHGDLVDITFPEGVEPLIMETFPARFSAEAESIVVKGQSYEVHYMGEGTYRFIIPGEIVPDAEQVHVGDLVRMFENAEATEPFAEGMVVGSGSTIMTYSDGTSRENYDIQVELPTEEVSAFMNKFSLDIVCTVVQADQEKEEILSGETPTYGESTDTVIRELEIMGVDKEYYQINNYRDKEAEETSGLTRDEDKKVALQMVQNCKFYVNNSMEKIDYKEVDFDTFTKLINETVSGEERSHLLALDCHVTMKDGWVTEVSVDNPWWDYGIDLYRKRPAFVAPYSEHWPEGELPKEEIQKLLNESFTLETEEEADISDAEGMETVQTYKLADKSLVSAVDDAMVLFRDANGELLYVETASETRVGWNNVYVGEADGVDFIMTMHHENREFIGEYSYAVFRLTENGDIQQMAGAYFEWGNPFTYDDELFKEWTAGLEYYLENSHLVLSTQNGEINLEKVSEADRYNYETLRPEYVAGGE